MTTALLTGFGLGFLVAAQVGPISLLAARSVILGRLTIGIMIGLGAATIDVAYGALGLAGAASLLRLSGLHFGLGLLGAAVLLTLGALALRNAIQAGDQAEPATAITSAPRAYLIALGGTAANPLTIASWAAVFAAASAAHISRTTIDAVLLLAGIGLGTTSWFTVLSRAMTLVRRRSARVHASRTLMGQDVPRIVVITSAACLRCPLGGPAAVLPAAVGARAGQPAKGLDRG